MPAATCTTNDYWTIKYFAVAGEGIAYLPEFFVETERQAGLLIPVLGDWSSPKTAINLIYRAAGTFPSASRRSSNSASIFIATAIAGVSLDTMWRKLASRTPLRVHSGPVSREGYGFSDVSLRDRRRQRLCASVEIPGCGRLGHKRRELYANEQWLLYRKASAGAGFQIEQHNTLLRTAPFRRPW